MWILHEGMCARESKRYYARSIENLRSLSAPECMYKALCARELIICTISYLGNIFLLHRNILFPKNNAIRSFSSPKAFTQETKR